MAGKEGTDMKRLKTAVIGCGNISGRHLKAVAASERCELAAVCDIVKEKVDASASEYGVTAFYHIDELLAWGQFDVLHICTPHYLHPEMAIAAMNAGKHVLCEKPLAITYEDALKMCECAKENGVTLGVCFQNRYNPASRYIKNLLDSGEMGRVIGLKGFVTWDRDESYYNADDWHGTLQKEGGGVVINQSIHTIDLLQWFADSDVRSVYGSVSQKRLQGKVETEDTADALIRFENGVDALFFGTLCYTENSPVFLEIACENGKITLYDDLTVYRNGQDKETITLAPPEKGKKSYWGSGHAALIADFYDAIQSGSPFAVSGESGAKAVKIVDSLYHNARH